MSAAEVLERVQQRRAEVCRHGQRPHECVQCDGRPKEPPTVDLNPPEPEKPREPRTNAERVMFSAQALAETHGTFTQENLIVWTWRRFPESFGLAGYSNQFPDSNRVITEIVGRRGLVARGLLERVGVKRYRVKS